MEGGFDLAIVRLNLGSITDLITREIGSLSKRGFLSSGTKKLSDL
jgi:hypothetical protein